MWSLCPPVESLRNSELFSTVIVFLKGVFVFFPSISHLFFHNNMASKSLQFNDALFEQAEGSTRDMYERKKNVIIIKLLNLFS